MSPKEHAPLVKAAVEKAMQLDDRFAEAHYTLGVLHYVYDWKWSEAEREFKRVIELNPNYVPAHMSYSSYLASVTGRVKDAAREIDVALEIDPLLPLSGAGGGLYLFLAGEFERALFYIAEALELDPNYPMARWARGLIYAQDESLPEAVRDIQEAVNGGLGTNALADLGRVYALMGKTDEALEILNELVNQQGQTQTSAFHIALVYVGLGESEEALQWLEKAYVERSGMMIYSRADPRLDPLRDDPRFQDLLRRMNFPEQ
jgi:tetratricopeptide (TPR) repeat protein